MFTGLLIIHIFYWSTNQFIAQRALAARSEFDARMGIIAAGFLKLLIPFISIATGVAAGFLFESRLAAGELTALPLPDDAFPLLVQMIVPAGYGLVGIITAGLIGAILSSIDSMMNSGATLFTFDFYKRFVNPRASERRLILVGRVAISGFVLVAAGIAALIYTEDAADNFFLKVPAQIGHVVPGMAVAFPRRSALEACIGVGSLLGHAHLASVLVRYRVGLRRLGWRRVTVCPNASRGARATAELPASHGPHRGIRAAGHGACQLAYGFAEADDRPLHVEAPQHSPATPVAQVLEKRTALGVASRRRHHLHAGIFRLV